MSDEKIMFEKKRGMNGISIICIIIVVALLSSIITYKLLDMNSKEETANNSSSQNSNVTKYEIQNIENPVIAVAKECSSSIVGITVETLSQNVFGMLQNSKGSGSGIIYTEDGYIITNFHVIEDAINSQTAVITVITLDEKEYPATIVGADEVTDLAVIKIEDGVNLKAASFGDSSLVEVGQLAVAIGNPLGQTLAGSVTVGYISAVNRNITSGSNTYNLLQTDAAINSGNSGGALLDSQGKVIGINSIKAYSTGVEGLGFAIPINDALPIIEKLIKDGKIVRPYIGISGFTLSEEMAEKYDLMPGVYVQQVLDKTPAASAGIKQGDVITKIDGIEITTFEKLNEYKNTKDVGDKIEVTVYRNKKEEKIKLVLEADN